MTSTQMGAFEAPHRHIRHRTATGETLAALAGAVRRAARTYRDWRETRNAIREIESLDARTLRDIGLEPSDIEPTNIARTIARFRGR